jgi:hypothetical protein
MAAVEYEIQVTIDGVVSDVVDAAHLLLALGRERLLAVAGEYLMVREIAEAGGLDEVTLDELALGAASRALLCQELAKLTAAARAALDRMTPEQQLAAARERGPS